MLDVNAMPFGGLIVAIPKSDLPPEFIEVKIVPQQQADHSSWLFGR